MTEYQRPAKSLWVSAIVAAALILQLAAAFQKSYWEDEVFTASAAQADTLQMIQTIASRDAHPPLSYLAYNFWGKVFGYEELGLRSLSVLFIGAALLLSYKLASSLFGDSTAVLTVLLLAASPFFLTYGHNVRYYALSAALTLAAALTAYRYYDSRKPVYLILYVLAGAALLYTNYLGAVTVLLCFLWVAALWRGASGSVKFLFSWLLANALIFTAFLPWIPVFLAHYDRRVSAPTQYASWIAEWIKRWIYLGYSFALGDTISPLNPVAWAGLAALAVVGIAVAAGVRRLPRNWWWLLVFFMTSAGASILISFVAQYPVSSPQAIPNHIFYAFPFFVILLAYGISRMKVQLAAGVVSLLVIAGGLGIYNYFTGRQFLKPILDVPWREVMVTIRQEASSDAVVFCNRADTTCPYYAERYGFEAHSAQECAGLVAEGRSEIWWLQSNVGGYAYDDTLEKEALDQIKKTYKSFSCENYAFHDPYIRWVKAQFTDRDDYEYRLNVLRFSEPIR